MSEKVKPVASKPDRPRVAGKQTVLTPWMAMCDDFCEHEVLRVPNWLEVSRLIDGWFTYFRSQITGFTVVRWSALDLSGLV